VRYNSSWLTRCGEIARAGQQHSGTADHGTVTIVHRQASRHAERLRLLGVRQLPDSHVPLGTFPGIWDITSWPQYWATQYSWLNGHQPWLASPLMVVQAWASGRWPTTPVIRQVNASTFTVTEPGGKADTVTGIRPVSVPGPWVITKVTYG